MFRRVAPFALMPLMLALAPSVATAQEPAPRTPERVRSVTLTGSEPCPPSTEVEVVVCSRINPDEQYRIPKEMRDTAEVSAPRSSWVNRTATMDQVSRVAGGLPNTCSPVGMGGQSGCAILYGRNWAAERRAAEKNDALVPGGGE